jgi:uncharacterized cupredoxin-like copper-binding protein
MRVQILAGILAGTWLLAACAGQPKSLEVTLLASEFNFEPAVIEVTAGTPVRLTLQNTGTLEHDFSVVEIPMVQSAVASTPMAGHDMGGMQAVPQLHVAAAIGQRATVEFTPTKAGSYDFFCTVPGHKEAGMAGVLVVSPR